MGHIFISYSHTDTEYAHALAEHLQSMGFSVWIDDRIDMARSGLMRSKNNWIRVMHLF